MSTIAEHVLPDRSYVALYHGLVSHVTDDVNPMEQPRK
jgi:hypothetical protein